MRTGKGMLSVGPTAVAFKALVLVTKHDQSPWPARRSEVPIRVSEQDVTNCTPKFQRFRLTTQLDGAGDFREPMSAQDNSSCDAKKLQ
jgi:hypothetical protein